MGYEQEAKSYLGWEKQNMAIQRPPGTAISLEWKKDHYIGSIQQTDEFNFLKILRLTYFIILIKNKLTF